MRTIDGGEHFACLRKKIQIPKDKIWQPQCVKVPRPFKGGVMTQIQVDVDIPPWLQLLLSLPRSRVVCTDSSDIVFVVSSGITDKYVSL